MTEDKLVSKKKVGRPAPEHEKQQKTISIRTDYLTSLDRITRVLAYREGKIGNYVDLVNEGIEQVIQKYYSKYPSELKEIERFDRERELVEKESQRSMT